MRAFAGVSLYTVFGVFWFTSAVVVKPRTLIENFASYIFSDSEISGELVEEFASLTNASYLNPL